MYMENSRDEVAITNPSDYSIELRQYEAQLLGILACHQLPTQNIFVNVDERSIVFNNAGRVIGHINPEQRPSAVYVSKFMAAVAAGLFDAAINYLWDETILGLRQRVAQYDLAFFYDNAISSPERRRELEDEEDLTKISDSELIYGAKEIDLISDIGFRHLDYIRYMRNWLSAAHPNQNQVTGLQLISWLETCIKEVIALPMSNIAVETKKLLYNIKNTQITQAEAKEIATFFINLTNIQINTLISGFFGIYTRIGTTSSTRQNIRFMLPNIWTFVEEPTRQQLGIKYGKFVANNDSNGKKWAREFLETISGQAYIPDDLRATEIKIAIDNLLQAHREINNFYSEPPLARELSNLVGTEGNVPKQVELDYVLALVEVFMTNGNGIAWNADPIYKELLNLFNQRLAILAITSFTRPQISSHLQFNLCQDKFKELLSIMNQKVSLNSVKDLIRAVIAFKGQMDQMKSDPAIQNALSVLKTILTTSI